jgi:hypothetical protein
MRYDHYFSFFLLVVTRYFDCSIFKCYLWSPVIHVVLLFLVCVVSIGLCVPCLDLRLYDWLENYDLDTRIFMFVDSRQEDERC